MVAFREEGEHATLGKTSLPGLRLRFLKHDDVEVTQRDHGASPTLGRHFAEIHAWVDSPPGPRTAPLRARA